MVRLIKYSCGVVCVIMELTELTSCPKTIDKLPFMHANSRENHKPEKLQNIPLLGNNLRQPVHTRISVTKQ